MVDEILIERAARRHIDGGRGATAPAGTPDLLPGAGDGPGVAAQDRGIKVSDIDPQLEGIRADHPTHRSVAQAMFDLTTLQWKVAATVAADRASLAESIGERLLQIAEQDLDLEAGAAEDDGLHAAAEKHLGDSLALQRGRAPDAELAVDDRRVVEEQPLGPAGCAVVVDQRHRAAGKPLGQLFRVGAPPRARRPDPAAPVEGA